MTDNRTTEKLRELLDEQGIKWRSGLEGVTFVGDWCFVEYENEKLAATCEPALTPGQAVAATLGNDDDYERKMDALLCRLTNGKWSKSRAYDLDFMEQCINEEFETLYAEELADAELGNGTLTAEQVREVLLYHLPHREYYSVEQTDAWQAIADELNARVGRTCKPTEEGCCPICGEDLVRCDVGIGAGGGAVELDPPMYHNYCPQCGARVKAAKQ